MVTSSSEVHAAASEHVWLLRNHLLGGLCGTRSSVDACLLTGRLTRLVLAFLFSETLEELTELFARWKTMKIIIGMDANTRFARINDGHRVGPSVPDAH